MKSSSTLAVVVALAALIMSFYNDAEIAAQRARMEEVNEKFELALHDCIQVERSRDGTIRLLKRELGIDTDYD